MAKQTKATKATKNKEINYCKLPQQPERVFHEGVHINRQRLILVSDKKWNNGTSLHYFFFDNESDGQEVIFSDGSKQFITWKGGSREKDRVREAFKVWKDLGVGLNFVEVQNKFDAELRIGFMKGDGSWSYLGRDALSFGFNERTMNFGWNISDDLDTALHEIGHALGFPHEHQNPNAGIVWNEQAVYDELAKPPNRWKPEVTYHNIIRKISPDLVKGSDWDPNSIMHYPFKPGLIEEPEEFKKNGLYPEPGLSERDMEWIRFFYPEMVESDLLALQPSKSEALALGFGQQQSFKFKPESSRKYHIKTFGEMDGVMVLYKKDKNGQWVYVSGDDDSGLEKNAEIEQKLFKDEEYLITYRQHYNTGKESAIMLY
jgi:hypothetical protein